MSVPIVTAGLTLDEVKTAFEAWVTKAEPDEPIVREMMWQAWYAAYLFTRIAERKGAMEALGALGVVTTKTPPVEPG